MSSARLTPTQRVALRWLADHDGYESPFPNAVPGGIRTVRALVVRGMVAWDHGRVLLTDAGRKRATS